MDMSPKNTLMNCGSSSILVLRMKSPNGNFRGSSFVACTLSASSFTFMDLNLMHLNILPSNPVLSCMKNTGPGDVIFIMIATISQIHGKKNTNTIVENKMSNARLMILFTMLDKGSSRLAINGMFSAKENDILPSNTSIAGT